MGNMLQNSLFAISRMSKNRQSPLGFIIDGDYNGEVKAEFSYYFINPGWKAGWKMKVPRKPVVAITMGDPSGVGPEVILKGLSSIRSRTNCVPLIIGAPRALEREKKNLGINLDFDVIHGAEEIRDTTNVAVLPGRYELSLGDMHYGNLSDTGARAVIDWIELAVSLALKGFADAICTAPLNKAVLKERAGFRYPGHTEFLAHLTDSRRFVMMLAGKKLRVSLVTIHCPLSKVAELISKENIAEVISITAQALLKDFGLSEPSLAVAGLNPHAGESGKFGTEEIDIIAPAIKKAREQGIDVHGPFPPDAIYREAYEGKYDAVVSMYHDQGLIPLKLLHFYDAVNVTLGLPVVRTSVDHGTAYDIAGRGKANPASFMEALDLAAKIAINRRRKEENS